MQFNSEISSSPGSAICSGTCAKPGWMAAACRFAEAKMANNKNNEEGRSRRIEVCGFFIGQPFVIRASAFGVALRCRAYCQGIAAKRKRIYRADRRRRNGGR